MKKTFTLAVLLLLAVAARCQTYVSGFINANTTWNVAGAPYIVTGNTLVSIGYTLTIEPGVVVKFDTSCALQIDGELIAIGTASNRITFTSNQASPQPGDWAKLHIGDNSVDAVYDANGYYLSGTILKYCDVLYAGSLGFGAIHVESASPYISHCNVRYSKAAGIYCVGSTYLLDSSLVSDNADYGLYFDQFSQHSCGLLVNGDTIRSNANGGLFLGSFNASCSTVVQNNYFISNITNGAILSRNGGTNMVIKDNYIFNNTSTGYYGGIVWFEDYSFTSTIERNLFINNSSQNNQGGIIYFYDGAFNDTIRCNSFLNNQITGVYSAVIHAVAFYSGFIKNNVFDGNSNNTSNGFSILNVRQNPALLDFSNNIVRNNSALSGICCYINTYLNDSTQLLRIDHNEFSNNTASNIIYLDGTLINNSNLDFLYMKHNNFLDANNHIEFYNNIPYGSPNIRADSNYWGSTSTQHIDSIIYDYFDFANNSVVYYLPILSQAEEIDTTCSLSFPTTISSVQKNVDDVSRPFPNPFSSYTEITVGKELKDASLLLYNVFGQKVYEMDAINGKHISLRRESLPSGIYIYEITENGQRIGNGKLMAE